LGAERTNQLIQACWQLGQSRNLSQLTGLARP